MPATIVYDVCAFELARRSWMSDSGVLAQLESEHLESRGQWQGA